MLLSPHGPLLPHATTLHHATSLLSSPSYAAPTTTTTILLADASSSSTDALTSILGGAAAALTSVAAFTILAAAAALGTWLLSEQYVLSLRAKARSGGNNYSRSKSRSVEPGSPAYVQPRDSWRLSELRGFDGSGSSDGPILLAADGIVFNVSPARNFYGPDGEYAIMGGNDATRYLAKNTVEESEAYPDGGEAAARAVGAAGAGAAGAEQQDLSIAEAASLGLWVASFRNKYDIVGKLVSEAEADAMDARARDADRYYERMESLSDDDSTVVEASEEARERLEALWRQE